MDYEHGEGTSYGKGICLPEFNISHYFHYNHTSITLFTEDVEFIHQLLPDVDRHFIELTYLDELNQGDAAAEHNTIIRHVFEKLKHMLEANDESLPPASYNEQFMNCCAFVHAQNFMNESIQQETYTIAQQFTQHDPSTSGLVSSKSATMCVTG